MQNISRRLIISHQCRFTSSKYLLCFGQQRFSIKFRAQCHMYYYLKSFDVIMHTLNLLSQHLVKCYHGKYPVLMFILYLWKKFQQLQMHFEEQGPHCDF